MSVLQIRPPDHAQIFPVTGSDGKNGWACVAIFDGGGLFEGVHDTREEAMQHVRGYELPIFFCDEWWRSTSATTLD
jgi:hypothetical protein